MRATLTDRRAASALSGLRRTTSLILLVTLTAVTSLSGCAHSSDDNRVEVFVMEGSPYEMGLQHGEHFRSEIRRYYTKLLVTGILPNVNRDRDDVAGFLREYQKPQYDDGQFSYEILRQSADTLIPYIPEEYLEEMRGIADGSGLEFEEILIFNTFLDSLLSFRAVSLFIRLIQAPRIKYIEFQGGLESDGADNDSDGEIDEPGEGRLSPYESFPHAVFVEVPTGARLVMVLSDLPEGVDPTSIRITLDRTLYTTEDAAIGVYQEEGSLDTIVTFAPPDGFAPASVVSLKLQARDMAELRQPPLPRTRPMRDERVVITTAGYGKARHEVDGRGVRDDLKQPTPIAFGVRGDATVDGGTLLAQNFALLDSGVSHEHTVLFVRKPDGKIPSVMLGWTGFAYGLSGINAEGLACANSLSDSLDNSLVEPFAEDYIDAVLTASGVPIGFMGRYMLENLTTVEEAVAWLSSVEATFGWNILLADRHGSLAAVEVDADVLQEEDHGFYSYTPDARDPENLDYYGQRLGSVGPDDLRMSAHFQKNVDDIDHRFLLVFYTRPQRNISTYYTRSIRTFYLLGDQIRGNYGLFDVPTAINVLQQPELYDERDSMNAAVFETDKLIVNYAMGEVPAPLSKWRRFDFGAFLATGEVAP